MKEQFRNVSHIAGMDSSYLNDFVEDEFGVIHIGPWQYSSDISSTVADFENNNSKFNINSNSEKQDIDEVLRDLEYSRWMIGSDESLNYDSKTSLSSLHDQVKIQNSLSRDTAVKSPTMFKTLPMWLCMEYIEVFTVHNKLRDIKSRIDKIRTAGSDVERQIAVSYYLYLKSINK
jgi:hypothetical protein